MSRHPAHIRLFAALCLLLFQLQVFAAGTLGCAHSGKDHKASSGCPHALAGGGGAFAAMDAGDTLDDPAAPCQKCNLSLCAAGWHLLPGEAVVLPPAGAAITAALPGRHFYLFSPDGLSRPPISVSG